MIVLKRADAEDVRQLWEMQVEAFAALLQKYQDFDTNPGNEPEERVKARLEQSFTYFYFITDAGENVGAIRVVDKQDGSRKRISPLFILPQYRNKGYAQAAMREAEKLHGIDNWGLDTVLEERGNCYLYEKMGYRRTGGVKKINEKMTLVFYEKN